jgi:type IV secretion system protein VirB6
MPLCAPSAAPGVVNTLIDTVDCHIRVLVHDSYRDLVGPGTIFATAFTGLLTIYIALFGYQLLLGRGGLRVTELPVAAVKVGLILAFITSWAAYQAVIFNLLFDGPRDIMRVLLSAMARDGSGFNGDVYAGLESTYARLAGAAGVYGAQASPAANILQGGPMLGSGLLWLSAIGMLLSTLGVILAAKIVLGFLLAVGPIFVGLFLFDATRGFFDGWLRTTVGFALLPLAANVFAAAMISMLQPFLDLVGANAARNLFDMGPIVTIGLIVAVFGIVMLMALRLCAGIASGFSSSRGQRDRATASDRSDVQILPMRSMARAEETAARAAMMDASGDEARQVDSRRTTSLVDAVSRDATPLTERLGQSQRRMPRPATRNGES